MGQYQRHLGVQDLKQCNLGHFGSISVPLGVQDLKLCNLGHFGLISAPLGGAELLTTSYS